MDEPQLETVSELVAALDDMGLQRPVGTPAFNVMDDPVYARSSLTDQHFIVRAVERVVVEGEQRTVIVVREVDWPVRPVAEKMKTREVECWDRTPHGAHSHNEKGDGDYDWCPGVMS